MAAQKHTQKIVGRNFFAFLNAYKPKSQLIKALNSFDFSRSCGRLSQNPKTEDFRKLFLPENDFKAYSTVNFQKENIQFWRPGNQPKK